MEEKKRITELDALRGLAAVSVMLFHYTYGFNHDDPNLLFHYGNLGVYLFFIISGFVITLTLVKNKNAADFLAARVARLYPAYWAAIGFLTLAGILAVKVFPAVDFAIIPHIDWGVLTANLTMFQHWLHYPDIDGVFWSLAVELVFYLVVALLLLIKKFDKVEWLSLLWLVAMYINFANGSPFTALLPILKYGNLFIAGIVFYNWRNDGGSRLRYLLLALCVVVQYLISTPLEAFAVLLFFGLFYLLINNKLGLLNNKISLYLGFVSYPVYLIHENSGAIMFALLGNAGLDNLWLKIVICMVVVFAVASFIAYVIERPLMKIVKQQYSRLRKFIVIS